MKKLKCKKCGVFKSKTKKHVCINSVWNKGKKGVQVAWNKGISPSESTRKQILI